MPKIAIVTDTDANLLLDLTGLCQVYQPAPECWA